MPSHKLTKLELQIMEALWTRPLLHSGDSGIFPCPESSGLYHRPDYGLSHETKRKIVRRVKRISNADILKRQFLANRRKALIDELLALLGGRAKPVMAHFVKSGKLTLKDVKEAEKMLRELAKEANRKG